MYYKNVGIVTIIIIIAYENHNNYSTLSALLRFAIFPYNS